MSRVTPGPGALLRIGLAMGSTIGLAIGLAGCSQTRSSEDLVRAYLWPANQGEFEGAAAAIAADPMLADVSRARIAELARLIAEGPGAESTTEASPPNDSIIPLSVAAPRGRTIPVLVRLPSRYSSARRWPLMLAMHGGPPGSTEQALQGAERMIRVWAEAAEVAGWIVVSPAMVSVIARDGRSQERLPYEIFHPEEARAVIDAVRSRFEVDSDRLVSTGISLGSNFSIQFAAAHPDWLSAIVPVSTEGESREHLLRNLVSVPVYVLEGSQDQNIRGVGGPRALDEILTAFGYDLTYREFGDRAHEGFQEHYPDVLRWLESRPRQRNPHEVLRVPHTGIMPVARRIHWIEADHRQALLRARVSSPTQIDVTARWTGGLTLFLNDELLNLDEPISIYVNAERVFSGRVSRSALTVLEEVRRHKDGRRIYAAKLNVTVPTTKAAIANGAELWEQMTPIHAEGQLSFWEMYATRALDERFSTVGFEGTEVVLPEWVQAGAPEQIGIEVTRVDPEGAAARAGLTVGDVLLTVDGEPFFHGRGGVSGLHGWLLRELRETPRDYPMVVGRADQLVTLSARYRLGEYTPPDR